MLDVCADHHAGRVCGAHVIGGDVEHLLRLGVIFRDICKNFAADPRCFNGELASCIGWASIRRARVGFHSKSSIWAVKHV